MSLSMLSVSALKPYEKNPRRVSERAIDAVAKSIQKFGFRAPVIVGRDGVIIAGHTRYLAAKKLGLTEIPCVSAADLTPEQVRGLRIADNRTAELTSWDDEALRLELQELTDADVDMTALGFSDGELTELLAPVPDGKRRELPHGHVWNKPKFKEEYEPVTRHGDLFEFGSHRLLCADASEEGALQLLTEDVRDMTTSILSDANAPLKSFDRAKEYPDKPDIAMCYTDPLAKYRMRYSKYEIKNREKIDEWHREMLATLTARIGIASNYIREGGSVFICLDISDFHVFSETLGGIGIEFVQSIYCPRRMPLHCGEELLSDIDILWYGRKGRKSIPSKQMLTNLWESTDRKDPMEDGCQLPIDICSKAISVGSVVGDYVLDIFPFGGNTLAACEMTGRKALLCEPDAVFCDVIRRRWCEMKTGKTEGWEEYYDRGNRRT